MSKNHPSQPKRECPECGLLKYPGEFQSRGAATCQKCEDAHYNTVDPPERIRISNDSKIFAEGEPDSPGERLNKRRHQK